MNWVLVKIQESSVLSPFPPPLQQASTTHDSGGAFNLNNKVSPSILLIIIILAIIFFISGLLHLLVRFLLRPQNRDPDDLDSVTALQGQLQQLFHLHDSGVDQSFIDTLPVFNYKSIIGLKNYPFDCAVCLCEFELEDKLRLLPKCSHAFHMECIDTWLLSHSTCPLCRASLLSDFSSSNNNYGCSPVVLVLESGSESSREIVPNHSHELGRSNSISISRLSLSSHYEDVVNASDLAQKGKSCEIQEKTEEGEKVVHVKLGKFKNVDPIEGEEGISSNNIDSRRCYSMGSFAYVLDETTSLHVPIRTNTPLKKASNKTPLLTQGLRSAVSECGCDSRRDFNGFEAFKIAENSINNGINIIDESKILGKSNKKESFSVSKIWLREKKDDETNSRRAFSFRFPVSRNNVDTAVHGGAGGGGGRRTVSEVDVGKWVNGGGSCDEENQSYNSMECQPKTPSFARRTILWLMGKQNKVVHSSFSSNL